MTWKDKLEIGLKEDAPYRRDNLPDSEKAPDGPETQPGDPTRSPEEPGAREAAEGPWPTAKPDERMTAPPPAGPRPRRYRKRQSR